MKNIIVVPDQQINNAEYKRKQDPLKPIQFDDEDRVKNIDGFNADFSYSMYASTFVSNRPTVNLESKLSLPNTKIAVDTHDETSSILDGYYSAATLDGYVFAMGDGCGGHVEKDQDKKIRETVDYTMKIATGIMLRYSSPTEIEINITNIVNEIDAAVKKKYNNNPENTTLVLGRAFKTDNGYEVVGINIGDSMCIAYNPQQKKMFHIAPAIVTEQKSEGALSKYSIGETSANFPSEYDQNKDCYFFRETLPEGSYIIPMTDGLIDQLPQERLVQEKKQRTYIWLDADKMKKVFAPLSKNASLSECIRILMKEAITVIEGKRHEQAMPAAEAQTKGQEITEEQIVVLGDDCLIAGLKLPTKKEDNHYILHLFKAAITNQLSINIKPIVENKIEENNNNNAPPLTQDAVDKFVEMQAQTNIEKFVDHFGLQTVTNMLDKLDNVGELNEDQVASARKIIQRHIEASIQSGDEKKLKNIAKQTNVETLSRILIDLSKQRENPDDLDSKPVFAKPQLQLAQRAFYTTLYEEQLEKRAAHKETALFWGSLMSWTGFVPVVMYFWYQNKKNNEEIQIREQPATKLRIPKSNVKEKMEGGRTSDEIAIPLIHERPSMDISSFYPKEKTFLHDDRDLRKISVTENNPNLLFTRRGIQTKHIDDQQSCCIGLKR